MLGRARAELPEILAVDFLDRQVVDAREPSPHQTILSEFPVLVTVGTEPVARVVVPLVGEADGDPVLRERPQLLDQPVVELARPFACQEGDDRSPTLEELGTVAPDAVGGIGQRDACRIAAVPTVSAVRTF
jgi:hypothetical protein